MIGWEILFIGIALSMDAFAVGMTDGMLEPKMPIRKILSIAFAFAFFQFFMPLLGYYFGAAFSALVEKIAPWLSFALLGFIGGKMIFDCVTELVRERKEPPKGKMLVMRRRKLGFGQLLVQAIATSLDALAVGVTLLAAETTAGLPFHVTLCTFLIGATTFSLSLIAVQIGKQAGNRFSNGAEMTGGIILVGIGVKILLDGLL